MPRLWNPRGVFYFNKDAKGNLFKMLILPWRLCQNQACLYDFRSFLLARFSLFPKMGQAFLSWTVLPSQALLLLHTLAVYLLHAACVLQGPHAYLLIILDLAAQSRLVRVEHI